MIVSRGHMPIFITGTERSGSTIVAKILAMAGAWTGRCTPMMENKQIKQAVDRYYAQIQADPTGQFPLPDIKTLNLVGNWAQDVRSLIVKEGYPDHRIWMFKSSRICQTWPLWFGAFPDAKYLIVRRRTGDVIQSCLKTAFMNAYSSPDVLNKIGVTTEPDGWKWWIDQHEKRYVEMIETGLNCRVIWPDRMLDGDYSQIVETLDWLRLRWNSRIIPAVEIMLNKRKCR